MDQAQKPSIGRVVHYVLSDGDGVKSHAVGEHRPAIVVRVWPGEYGTNECPDGVNLQAMIDGSNDIDGAHGAGCLLLWKTSIPYSSEPKPGTWHWPERV